MTRKQAAKRAIELREKEVSHAQIGTILAKEGYVSTRTKKALSPEGVGNLLRAAGYKPDGKRIHRKKRVTRKSAPKQDKLDLLKSVRKNESLSASDKESLTDLILEL